MRHWIFLLIFAAAFAQIPPGSLHGLVTDPSAASVPGAQVVLHSGTGDRSTAADNLGRYSFDNVAAGSYTVRIIAPGFSSFEKQVQINGAVTLDARLAIEAEQQQVNVQEQSAGLTADAASNTTALVLGQKELEVLSDDPDELSQELQAMAGPGAGPNGADIYIDGFTGGNLPPKSSIREVRINSNPFAPEFDRPGFGRIEIFTRPGTDNLHGQLFGQFNDQYFNARSPLLTEAETPPYKQEFFGLSVAGPVLRNKASFTFDFERRDIDQDAFVYATSLDSSLQQQTINEGILTPQTRTSFSPRIDYTLNPENTLTVRYQGTRIQLDGQSVGGFNLPSTAYNQSDNEDAIQLTETAVLSAQAITETRFQFLSSRLTDSGGSAQPSLIVQEAFQSGGSVVGNSGTTTNRWELSNISTVTEGTHTFKWGARVRQQFLDDTSWNNFAGTYTFFGGSGPELDSADQPIAGTSIPLTALEVYQRTLLFEKEGLSASQIAALGGGPSEFTINGGTPATSVSMFDAGLFFGDDWRVRPNLMISLGLRYELQTNIHDYGDLAPRVAVAWGIGGRGSQSPKTVLRAGFGVFYDRIAATDTLAALRYNGLTQQSYVILNPTFFPDIPSLSTLESALQPQELQYLDRGIVAPGNYQASVGIDRQVNQYFKLGAQYVNSRGVHLERQRDINAPTDGVYPFGDDEVRLLTESTGFSRSNMLFVNPRLTYKKLFLFGFYSLSYGMDDSEGLPANPYNLRSEWGPSTWADVRNRAMMGTSIPLPWKISINPFIVANSGAPYNITTGLDPNDDGFATARPALLGGVTAASCTGSNLVYAAGFGCFNLAPAAGVATIERNSGRGPASVTFNLRVSRTWGFGSRGESGLPDSGPPPPGAGGARGGPSGPPPGGGPGGPGGGPPPGGGMFGGGSSGNRYTLTLSAMAHNLLNHPNYAAPVGDLSSPFFGESLGLANMGPVSGNSTYDRKIDLQLRFSF